MKHHQTYLLDDSQYFELSYCTGDEFPPDAPLNPSDERQGIIDSLLHESSYNQDQHDCTASGQLSLSLEEQREEVKKEYALAGMESDGSEWLYQCDLEREKREQNRLENRKAKNQQRYENKYHNDKLHNDKLHRWGRIEAYVHSILLKKPYAMFSKILIQAMRSTGYYPKSKRVISELKKYIRTRLNLKSIRTAGNIEYISLNERFPTPNVLYICKNSTNYRVDTAKPNSLFKLKKLAFALVKAKPNFFKYSDGYSDGFKTLSHYHYDNCKIEWCPKIVYNTIFPLLKDGVRVSDIVSTYDRLLQKWHELATISTNNPATNLNKWSPAGLLKDLRETLRVKSYS